jgi:hypothetical protein
MFEPAAGDIVAGEGVLFQQPPHRNHVRGRLVEARSEGQTFIEGSA